MAPQRAHAMNGSRYSRRQLFANAAIAASRPARLFTLLPRKRTNSTRPRVVRFVPIATERSGAKPRAYSITSSGRPEQNR